MVGLVCVCVCGGGHDLSFKAMLLGGGALLAPIRGLVLDFRTIYLEKNNYLLR